MYFDDAHCKIEVQEKWRLTNHSAGDMLSFQLKQIIE